ncbi:MAG TPA: carbon-nitrogen hydrolase family protein [Streptosporangiaceae bacterium]
MSVVRVATCQFPVSARIEVNLEYVTRQVRAAKARGADVAHFPEGALSGYAGADFDTFADVDWDALRQATTEVLRCARESGIWVVLGSAHRLSDATKPHNSLYVIDDAGQITTSGSARDRTWSITAPVTTPARGSSTGSAAGR